MKIQHVKPASLIKLVGFILVSCLSIPSAFATGATVNLQAEKVPTLSGFMLIILSVLLIVVAYKIAKQKSRHGGNLFLMLLGASALVMGGEWRQTDFRFLRGINQYN